MVSFNLISILFFLFVILLIIIVLIYLLVKINQYKIFIDKQIKEIQKKHENTVFAIKSKYGRN